MGLQSFERSLERMVDGVFTRGSRSSIRPVELGRRLQREIDDHRSVDVRGRRIVPNEFTLTLSPKDHEAMTSFEEALRNELVDSVREYARSEGYHFLGPISVELATDPEAKPGRVSCHSQMREGVGGMGQGSLLLPSGERISLNRPTMTIGRLPECEITLLDPNVSRRHTEIRSVGSTFVVRDLGSTNGTMVNGVRLQHEHGLTDGDIVSVGSTHMRFEAL